MISVALSIVILLLAATQPSSERMGAACVYAGVNLAHLALISPWIGGYGYYLSAAMADIFIMAIIIQMPRITAVAISLLRVCLVEVIVNAIGWILWFKYFEPALYNSTFYLIYGWIVLILMRKDRADDVGGYKVDHWTDFLRLVIGSSRFTLSGRS